MRSGSSLIQELRVLEPTSPSCQLETALFCLSIHFSPCHSPTPGETGIGKSTLMNTLFNTTFETEEASHHEECVRLRPQTYDLQESNVHLKLTIVDAVGFGDQINKDDRQETGRAGLP